MEKGKYNFEKLQNFLDDDISLEELKDCLTRACVEMLGYVEYFGDAEVPYVYFGRLAYWMLGVIDCLEAKQES